MNTFNLIIFCLTFLLQLSNIICQSQCETIVTRPEIRELSSTQLRAFINAIQQLRNRNGVDVYERLSNNHYSFADNAHGVPAFFPWHREFLRRFELELQTIDPSIVLPYWDWSIDSQSPERSVVFRSDYFGGNGRPGDRCLDNGPFAGWFVNVPNVHCLKRDFDNNGTISSFYSPEALESIFLQSTSYDQFRQIIEGSPHANVHVGIGGEQGDLTNMFSSNDPLFFLHHAFVDLLWHEWQLRNPSLANTYNGVSDTNRTVSINDNMIPFNIPVSAAMNTLSPRYCYTYKRYSASLPNIPRPQINNNSNSQNQGSANNISASTNNNNNNNNRNTPNQTPSRRIRARPNQRPSGEFLSNNFPSRIFRRQISLLGSITSTITDTVTSTVSDLISPAQDFDAYNQVLSQMTLEKVRYDDRETRHKLRYTKPVPERYINMNHLSLQNIREFESKMEVFVSGLNCVKNFVPKAKLL